MTLPSISTAMYSDTLQRRCVSTVMLGSKLNASNYRMSGVNLCPRRVPGQDLPTLSLLLLRGEGSSFSLVCCLSSLIGYVQVSFNSRG